MIATRLLAPLALALAGCGPAYGDLCAKDDECLEGSYCLQGKYFVPEAVEDVGDVNVCVTRCETDADCLGVSPDAQCFLKGTRKFCGIQGRKRY